MHDTQFDTYNEEGFEAPDLAAARLIAKSSIWDVFAEEALRSKLDFRGYIDIADANGRIFDSIPFKDAFTILGL
nr:hypothetical protein [Sphingomonas prati]